MFLTTILVLNALGSTFAQGNDSPNYGDPSIFLIDSLDLDKLTRSDSILIDTCLRNYRLAKDDTGKIEAINQIVEVSWDSKVWPRYNLWIYKKSQRLLANKHNEQVTRTLTIAYSGAMNNIGLDFKMRGEIDSATFFNEKCLKLQKDIGEMDGYATTLNNIGSNHYDQGDFKGAVVIYQKCMVIYEESENNRGLGNSYNNIAAAYEQLGDVPKAIEYFLKGLNLYEALGDKESIGACLNNIAHIYSSQGEIQLARKYYERSLKLRTEIGAKQGIATAYNNIGFLYEEEGIIDTAMMYYEKSLKLYQETGFKKGEANSHNNIGGIMEAKGLEDEALASYQRSFEINQSLGSKRGMINSLNNLGGLLYKQGKIEKARITGLKSFKLAKETGAPQQISSSANLLRHVYTDQNKPGLALEMYSLYIQMKDSLHNADTEKSAIKQQTRYNYEKQKALDDLENIKKVAIEKEKKEKQRIVSYAISVGAAFLVIFLIFVFNRLKVTKRQKLVIEEQKYIVDEANEELNQHNEEILAQRDQIEYQKNTVEHQNKMILSSINYAKRIQEAILPTDQIIEKAFSDSFVLYKPKDIVSGDFYWLEHLGDKVIWAAVDCTGHGVPGAFMSILGANGLKKIVLERGIHKPSEILTHLTEHVVDSIKETKEGETVQDGMDIALCSWDIKSGKLEFAGAYNPMYLIRDNELSIIKGTKRPVGRFIRKNLPEFENNEIQLQKNDRIYIFTDGYADQFGGENSSKFSSRRMKEKLLAIHQLPLSEQKSELLHEYNSWRGNENQLDDICIIGVLF